MNTDPWKESSGEGMEAGIGSVVPHKLVAKLFKNAITYPEEEL